LLRAIRIWHTDSATLVLFCALGLCVNEGFFALVQDSKAGSLRWRHMITSSTEDNNVHVYYVDKQPPRYSLGRIFMVLVSLALTAFLVGVILVNWTDPASGIGVALLVSPGFAVLLYEIVSQLMILHFLPRMRYELGDDALHLILGGPWQSRIPYASIDNVTRKDLKNDMFSSFGMPNVGALDLMYANEGTISMYSTHLYKDVILIKTKAGMKYGVSPADPDGFLKALGQILDNQRTADGVSL